MSLRTAATAAHEARQSRSSSRRYLVAILLALPFVFAPGVAFVQQSVIEFVPRDEEPTDLPEGPGREETFYACTACHGFKIVAQQGQSRWQWEETLDLMTEKHNMPALDSDHRQLILDYLVATYPPRDRAPAGWQNPFLGR